MLTEYQKYMKKRLQELKKDHPTMKQPQLMKLAAQGWSKVSGKTSSKKSSKRRSSKRRSSKRSQRR
jgi:hypothetical protein